MAWDIQRETPYLPQHVFLVQSDGLHLADAPQSLADDVLGSLQEQSADLREVFGTDEIPGLAAEDRRLIENHFREFGASVASHILIDPATDLPKVRSLLSSGFLGEDYIDFFAGDEDGFSSPGGISLHDMVVFYDRRMHHRRETLQAVKRSLWTRHIPADSLEEQVRFRIIDDAAHELGHTTVGQCLEDVVIETATNHLKGYIITSKIPFHFDPFKDLVDLPDEEDFLKEGEYYNGPLLSEGVAASHAAAVLAVVQKMEGKDYTPEDRSHLYSEVIGRLGRRSTVGTGQMNSAKAYEGLQAAYGAFPGLHRLITSLEKAEVSELDFYIQLKVILPRELRVLADRSSASAWDEFIIKTRKYSTRK